MDNTVAWASVEKDGRVLPVPIPVAVRPVRYGVMFYPPQDTYVGRSLHLYGEYSEAEVEIFRQMIPSDGTVIDVGAHIGAHTVAMARIAREIIAFEPQYFLYGLTCANMALTSHRRYVVFNRAVGAECGDVKMPLWDYTQVGNFGAIAMGEGLNKVSIMTIDSLNLKRVDFIKIDVEGMEAKVLQGAKETIQRCRPVMLIENDREPETQVGVITVVREFGYIPQWSPSPLWNPNNFYANPENVFGEICSVNMLCTPKERTPKDAVEVEGPLTIIRSPGEKK